MRDQVVRILRAERAILPAREVTDVVNEVSDEVVGLGPVERLLKDPEVSEVMVNGADDVYVERKGRIERVDDLLFEGLGERRGRNRTSVRPCCGTGRARATVLAGDACLGVAECALSRAERALLQQSTDL